MKNKIPFMRNYFNGYLNVWSHSHIGLGFSFSIKEWYACINLPFISAALGHEKTWWEDLDLEYDDDNDDTCDRCGVHPKGIDSHYCHGCIEEIRLETSVK